MVVRSCEAFFVTSLLLFLIGCGTSSPPSPHWRDKATLNERVASSKVGGFNPDESRLYHGGIQHFVNAHINVGSFTIRQIVDQEQARETSRSQARQRLSDAKAAREEQERKRRERLAYEAAHHDYCKDALRYEKAAASDGASHRAAYSAAVAGLAANQKCDDETRHLVNEGYLLSMKAFAEHYLSAGDSRTDFNQANALLVQCQTHPGLYGTHTGAGCETQEQYNIRVQTNWDIESY
jgi:hypothetical protein